MPKTKKNALAQLGRALSSYLKTASTDKGTQQKASSPSQQPQASPQT